MIRGCTYPSPLRGGMPGAGGAPHGSPGGIEVAGEGERKEGASERSDNGGEGSGSG
jgi:hypothetical protein